MIQEIKSRVRKLESFAFETTLSGKGYANKIPEWQRLGYHVKLIFLSLPNVDIALYRIAARVAQGGHNVPEQIVRRRFDAGRHNFEKLYKKIVDAWVLYDNSGVEPILLEYGDKI